MRLLFANTFVNLTCAVLVGFYLVSCDGQQSPKPAVSEHAQAEHGAVYRDLIYSNDTGMKLDVYQPLVPLADRPVVIFFYGGGWRNGEKKEYAFLGQTLAARGILTVVANYRLYPQAEFPGFIKDGADAVAWVNAHAAGYGGNPNRIFLMGHSSGAYIAAMLALDGQYLKDRGVPSAAIAGVIGLAGLYDFSPMDNPEYAPVFRNAPSIAATQPINYVTGHEPPMLLLSGNEDDVVASRNTISMAARIKAKSGKVESVIYPDMGHIGIMLPFSPLAHNNSTVVTDVTGFISDK